MSIRIESETARTNSYFSGCFAPGAQQLPRVARLHAQHDIHILLDENGPLVETASNPMPFKSSSGERKNTGSSPYAMRVS